MNVLNNRIQDLRNQTLDWRNTQTEAIGQRIHGYLNGLTETTLNTPLMKTKAVCLANIIENAKAVINQNELIVGYNYYGDDSLLHYEFSLLHRTGPTKDKFVNYLKKGLLTEDQIEFCLDVLEDIDYFNILKSPYLEQPQKVFEMMSAGLFWSVGTAENHTIIGYEKVLKLGFRGILEEIKQLKENLSWKDPESVHKRLLLESARIIAKSACNFGKKFSEEALELLNNTESGYNIDDLKQISEVCMKVPEKPAESFHEAIQSLWFAHIFNTWEDNINANSLGRLDQILYPYYKKDIEKGTLSRERAIELISCLWLKLYREYDVQQAILGGCDQNGNDATNELTYLMLDVTDALDFVRCLSVRLHKNSPKKLIQRSIEVVKKGLGIPFFFNDDTMIPALVDNDIEIKDARDYGAIGCVEITIPGKANPHAVSNRINLLKCLELALNNGKSMLTNKQLGPKTGDILEIDSLDALIEAYKKQTEFFIDVACFESNRMELQASYSLPMPYKSILTENCLESGKDFNAGGAKYNFHESDAMGIPNVADSLQAINTFVFKEKKYTLEEIQFQMMNDFPDEKIRQEMIHRASKYGNDIDDVDNLAAIIMDHFCNYLKIQRSIFHGGFFAQPFTFLWLIEAGKKTAATPDGRKKGDNLAYSLSPMQGRDFKGLTAMMNSLAKLPHQLAAGGPSAIIEVDPVLFNEQNIERMVEFLQSAVEKGVGQMQFNVIDEQTLMNAQLNPEKYSSLAVRVSGFSQRFCLLDKNLQDHIIARTKHKK